MARTIVVALTASLLISQFGCSFFGSSVQPLTVTCDDPEAELFLDGQPIGKGRAQVMAQRDVVHVITAKNGSRQGSAVVGYKLSAVGVLDIVGGFLLLFPFIGLAAPGSRQLDRESVGVILK